jgi:preprotein translocase subunit SecD
MSMRTLCAGMTMALGLSATVVWGAPLGLAIKSASVQADVFTGQPTLMVELEPAAQRSFAKLTTRHVGEVVDLLIDGKVVSSPRVQTPILGPSLVISGEFSATEAAALAQRLSRGDARVEVNPTGQ